ncbi:Single-stranded nucleic acid binding R3H protein [Euphorbia peplus]|nr:Single-stranded nucleic acid binding R3H protein [Euphorbia peplus]
MDATLLDKVDPFLVEALQNPRHRLTILRMELDIQRFLQNPDQQHFEFQHFATSYLRLAAHRVAQHYGLVTMVQDNGIDGLVNKILVKKTAESKYPAVCLSDIPAKQSESDKPDQVKIVIRSRPNKGSMNGSNDGSKRNPVRSVEERKEEYDKARARIFSGPGSPSSEDTVSQVSMDRKSLSPIKDDFEGYRASELDRNIFTRDVGSSRVAIFRDREKDRVDPDYDRSYDRYVRSLPTNQNFALAPYNMQKVQVPFMQYDTGIPQFGHMPPRTQTSINYVPQATPVMSPFSAVGSNQPSRDAAYVQWPSAAMMYAHSYDQFRHAVFQAPFCQQPLSFDYSQNH